MNTVMNIYNYTIIMAEILLLTIKMLSYNLKSYGPV